MNRIIFGAAGLSLAASAVLAESFDLGKVAIDAASETKDAGFETVVDSERIAMHGSENLAEAADTVSGVYIGTLGGRNETTVSIRGFDARRVGVFADGVPIYVPYDGNFDYGRFLTSDISEITIAKGFSSVLYGANTMAGVINLVSRKPDAPFEAEVTGSLVIDGGGDLSRYLTGINLGGREGGFYGQLGASYAFQDHFRLSDSYTATAEQPGGDRLRSENRDRKVSLKVGYVADDASEIALSYVNQEAEKQQPPVTSTAYSRVKYWDWPFWDKESVALNGKKIFDGGYLKGNLYYDSYNNSLFSYDDATYTTMNFGYAFKSEYDDYSYGGRLEGGVDLGRHTLKAALNYKNDVHRGYDIDKATELHTLAEEYHDAIYSLGVEGTFVLGGGAELIAGVGYDRSEPGRFYDTNPDQSITSGDDQSAVNPQIALVYEASPTSTLRASIARKTHLPTMKERYSRKLGYAVANPDLEEERATHYELAYTTAFSGFSVGSSIYYSRIEDAIQSLYYDTFAGKDRTRNENSGDFGHTGLELDLGYASDAFEAGLSYAYIHIRNLDDNTNKTMGVPKHDLLLYGTYAFSDALSFYGNMRYRKGVYSQDGSGNYLRVPSFTTFDLKASYEILKGLRAEAAVKNLFDRNYAYDLGFPEAGREFVLSLAYRY